ncbi:hypothetical protein MXL54_24040 [Enterobacteriaceae bacterium G50]|nr:hypothetical protein [Enterobacteriaceae bacterium G50]
MAFDGLRFPLAVDDIVEIATAVVSFRLYQQQSVPFILNVVIGGGTVNIG